MLIRADLHVHTDTSPDSLLTPTALVQACRERGVDCVAVTDHDRLSGALVVARQAPPDLLVIVGEEVNTAQGELLGFFLQEEVPPRQDPLETARGIRAQGGLVGVPHPCDGWRRVLPGEVLESLWQAGLLDFIEGRNGRTLRQRANEQAEDLGKRLGLPLTAGSDAHSAGEVGSCYVLLPRFEGPQEFLEALAEGKLMGQPSPPWTKFSSIWARLQRL